MTYLDQTARLKTQRELITPEGVDLRLHIADAGQRASAFIIDALILYGSMGVASLVVAIAATSMGEAATKVIAVIWQLGLFIVGNGYFIAFELSPRAATPGKRMSGLRVASRSGGRLTADAIFARNAMRQLEVMIPLQILLMGLFTMIRPEALSGWMFLVAFIWGAIFAFFPLFNRDRLRAGDLLAGTWVVRAPRHKLIADLADDETGGGFVFTREQLEAYGVKELHVLEEVLRKGDRKTMRAVSERIRSKIGFAGDPGVFERDFLAAYYAALRQRLEQRLLFGHRRRDKFDAA